MNSKPHISKSVLPSDDTPSQMSPFSDERWDIDIEENRRRKEIHRSYVFKQFVGSKTNNSPKETEREEVKSPRTPTTPKQNPEEVPPIVEHKLELPVDSNKRDYLKYEPKIPQFKSFSEIKFDKPAPPNLYPVLKFPEKRIRREEIYGLPLNTTYVTQASQVPQELPPKPQFYEYKDIQAERPKAEHYGVFVPLWPLLN